MGRSYCIQYCLRYCPWCFSPKCTLYTCGKYCGTMNDDNLESKALCKVQKFHECSFCSNRRHAAGKLLVIYIMIKFFFYFFYIMSVDSSCDEQFRNKNYYAKLY